MEETLNPIAPTLGRKLSSLAGKSGLSLGTKLLGKETEELEGGIDAGFSIGEAVKDYVSTKW